MELVGCNFWISSYSTFCFCCCQVLLDVGVPFLGSSAGIWGCLGICTKFNFNFLASLPEILPFVQFTIWSRIYLPEYFYWWRPVVLKGGRSKTKVSPDVPSRNGGCRIRFGKGWILRTERMIQTIERGMRRSLLGALASFRPLPPPFI